MFCLVLNRVSGAKQAITVEFRRKYNQAVILVFHPCLISASDANRSLIFTLGDQ